MKCTKGKIILYQAIGRFTIYTFKVSGEENCFDQFINKFENHSQYKKEFETILAVIREFCKRGIDFRKFRLNGEKTVEALLAGAYNLRLYCIPLGTFELLVGNGDVKTARRVQDCINCKPHWELMVALEAELMSRIQNSEIWRDESENRKDVEVLAGQLLFELGNCD
ncbi:hypothetical protein [Chitinophaga sp. sic0106]|uniref:hypothetical protein n=1 Tax=Chitinophaga sp. sic0106 TaxID=2854785 RepID=UPI001C492C83|nr:hypothetical protein [Chitinophaga sp. sic0106]MBV7531133.1 hypothetical protein [Chitinophaga sp. sic0106]